MIVHIGNKVYQANKKLYQELLKIASDAVPFGVYAVEKDGHAEMLREKCTSITQLKNLTRQFKAQGYKVYANGR